MQNKFTIFYIYRIIPFVLLNFIYLIVVFIDLNVFQVNITKYFN